MKCVTASYGRLMAVKTLTISAYGPKNEYFAFFSLRKLPANFTKNDYETWYSEVEHLKWYFLVKILFSHNMIVPFFLFGGVMRIIFHIFLDEISFSRPSTFPTVSKVYHNYSKNSILLRSMLGRHFSFSLLILGVGEALLSKHIIRAACFYLPFCGQNDWGLSFLWDRKSSLCRTAVSWWRLHGVDPFASQTLFRTSVAMALSQ